MLVTVREFQSRVASGLPDLIADLQHHTGRSGASEENSWLQSLPRLSRLLQAPELQCLHLYIDGPGHMELEYRLPASGMCADVVLLGMSNGRPSVVILELKHQVTRLDKAGVAEGLIEHRGGQVLHPSDQVRGYVEYCRHFHSAVHGYGAEVHGCVIFTRDFVTRAYREPPNDKLVHDYPIFTLSPEDLATSIPQFLCSKLTAANAEFAEAFTAGGYRQKRGFVRQVGRQILDTSSRTFELLDDQRRAFHLCRVAAADVVASWQKDGRARRVLVVRGPPGSGKSAVAARLWAELSLMTELPEGDLAFVTTSMSQSSNWAYIFDRIGVSGARGVLRKASAYHPLSVRDLGRVRSKHGRHLFKDAKKWREHLVTLRGLGADCRSGSGDQQTLVSIVDEAHSLVNTEREGASGPVGFPLSLGPQAFHIMRASVLTIFFLDPKQGYRHKENTRFDDLQEWATELGAGKIEVLDLSGVQFRCAGSVEYMSWVDSLLSESSARKNAVVASAWYPNLLAADSAHAAVEKNVSVIRRGRRGQPFDFRIYPDPVSMETALREVVGAGSTARLAASFSRDWKTQDHPNPHDLPPSSQDFLETCVVDGRNVTWSRVWNHVRGMDYSYFIQARPGSRIAIDALAEVGCPVAIRGFDFDYIGLLWLEDLIWRDGRWVVDLEHMKETGLTNLRSAAKREGGSGPATDTLLIKVSEAYRILLSRAFRGVFVWVKDEATREHLRASLGSQLT